VTLSVSAVCCLAAVFHSRLPFNLRGHHTLMLGQASSC
jgi:hypothetical protein